MMAVVGLIASCTGKPGGKQTGQKMTHYIEADGPFDCACAEFIALGFDPLYVELGDAGEYRKKAASKTRYTCPQCCVNAWAKPDVNLECRDCGVRLEVR
jgi:hypothetical protein